MKTFKIFAVLCIILSFSTNLANAQEKENGTVSYSMDVEIELELWCDGVYIDFMHDVFAEVHMRVHYNDGNVIWMKYTMQSTLLFNGITYKIHGKSNLNEDFQVAHYNIIGNDGSHYVGIVTADDHTNTLTFSKAMCPGN